MSCKCGSKFNKYVDVSNLPSEPWIDGEFVLGIDKCGNVIILDKPEYELTEEDVEKLATLVIDGDGNMALYDDGEYKATYTKEQIDELIQNYYTKAEVDAEFNNYYDKSEIDSKFDDVEGVLGNYYNKDESDARFVKNGISNDEVNIQSNQEMTLDSQPGVSITGGYPNARHSLTVDSEGVKVDGELIVTEAALENVVEYDSNDDVRFRNDIYLANNNKLFGIATNGGVYKIAEVSQWNLVDLGSQSMPLNLSSSIRPTVQLQGESGTEAHAVAFLGDVTDLQAAMFEALNQEIANREAGDAQIQGQLDEHLAEFEAFRTTVNQAFITVNNAINALGDRIDVAEGNIAINTSDIESLREAITNAEHFRGYFETTSEITSLPNPTNGDYAWNAETGTVWIYNGTTWLDSGDPIPDQTVSPSDSLPLIDGTASAGTTNEYSRGDHRHPTDTTRAAAADLDNYLLLAGNTQTTQMTGSIWLGTQNKVYFSDSGNTYVGIDQPNAGLIIAGAGAGGIDLVSELGTVKANGQRIIVNGQNDSPTQIASTVINLNGSGSAISLGSAQLAMSAASLAANVNENINLVSATGNIVLDSIAGKVYYGASTNPLNEIAKLSDINGLQDQIDAIDTDLGSYVKTSGSSMTGNLVMDNGADIVLDYNSTNPSAIYGQDDDGNTYNLIGIRTYTPATPTELDQVEVGSVQAQFNANSLYVPTVDTPTDLDIDTIYGTALPAGKHFFVLYDYLVDKFYSKSEVDDIIANLDIDLSNYYTIAQVNTLLASKLNTADLQGYLDNYLPITGGNVTGNLTVNGDDVATVPQLDNFLRVTGGTMVGDLTMANSNIIIDQEHYIGFYGDARVRIGYNQAAQELRITATSTDNGVDVVTNPSYPSSMFKYNGVEVATVDDVNAVTANLNSNYYTRTQVDQLIANAVANVDLTNYYTKGETDILLLNKANAADVYTKGEIDNIVSTIDISNYYDKGEIDTMIASYYNKVEINTMLANYVTSSQLATSLAGYYTSAVMDNLLGLKADKADTYTKAEVDALLADIDAVFTEEITASATSNPTLAITLTATPKEILMVQFERVMLYANEWTLSGNTLTLIATDLNYNQTNRIKILYK